MFYLRKIVLMQVTIKIPTKSYLRKFIEVTFGSDLKLTERNWIGVLVLNILKRKTFKNSNYDYKKYNFTYDDEIIFHAHLDKTYRYGCVLLEPQKFYINKSIDGIFKDEIIKQALINQSSYSIDFKTSILNILDAYDITEDELSYETLRKHYNRNYLKFKKRLIL